MWCPSISNQHTNMTEMSRRDWLLAGGAALTGYSVLPGDSDTDYTVAPIDSLPTTRTETYRPVAGGIAVSIADEIHGTLAGGVSGPSGEFAVLTNRHVVDSDICATDAGEVIGRTVYQPHAEQQLGSVLNAGTAGGPDSRDWALIEIPESDWSADILGLGEPVGTVNLSLGDRVVMSGVRTGLIGGDVIGLDVAKQFFGCQFRNLIQYTVDEDRDTSGNSGAFVGTVDSAGDFRVAGIHTFGDSSGRYAVPISRVLNDSGATLTGSTTAPETPTTSGQVDATAVGRTTNGKAIILVSNVGGEEIERYVGVYDDSSLVDSVRVTLSPLGQTVVPLDAPGVFTLQTGDVDVTIAL